MSALIDNGNQTLNIENGTHSAMRYANINRTSVLFVSISFIVLMIISLAWLIFYYIQRFRYIHAKDILARRLSNAAKKAMDKIPTKTIKPIDLERMFEGGLTECCAVCIDPFKTSDIVRILPCKHLFHKSCVDPWLLENRSCPMCKMDILKFYGLVYAGSQESILNIDVDIDMNQHYWHRTGRHRTSSGGEIEIVHIPIPSPMSRSNRRRNRERTPRVTTTNTHTQTHCSGPLSNSEYLVEPLNNGVNTVLTDESHKNCDSADQTCGDCGDCDASHSDSGTSSVQFSIGVEKASNENVTLPHVYAHQDLKSCDEKLVNYDPLCSEKY